MKRVHFIILAAVLACLTSCTIFHKEEKHLKTVIVYLAGNNNISAYANYAYNQIVESDLPDYDSDRVVLVFRHIADNTPKLSRFYKNSAGTCMEEILVTYPDNFNSAVPSSLAEVINDAQTAYPSEKYGLILWSHGTGHLPEGYYSTPEKAQAQRLSFGEDSGKEMEIDKIRTALSGKYFNYIICDCCLMGCVEVAYEWKDLCDYFVASPTEVLVDGYPYKDIMPELCSFEDTGSDMIQVARDFMNYYRTENSDATVAVVKTSELQGLANVCKPIFANHSEEIYTLDRSVIQPFFRADKHWFYDLSDFVRYISTDEEYASFDLAMKKAVIFKDATEYFLTIVIKKYSGLSIYIPRSEYPILNNYYKGLQWNKATGLVQ